MEEPDLISKLPDGLLHHILSFLDTMEQVVQTSVLSKRWRFVWTQIIPYLWFDEEDTMEEETDTDFISELPESLLVHILSNLTILDAVQTSVLSKRWRYIWTSLPRLWFSHMSFLPIDDQYGSGSRFVGFIDDVMSVRSRSSSTIHTLGIHEYHDVHLVTNDSVVRWINVGLQHNLVELDINVMLDLVLPRSLLNCGSLERLTLCLRGKELNLTSETPADLVALPALRMLYIDEVNFVGGDVSNLISRCPVLETLYIFRCCMSKTNNLIVNAPQLKVLKILYLTCFGEHRYHVHKVTGFTPNLTSFECSELWMMGDYSLLKNVSPLVEAEICYPNCKTIYNRGRLGKVLAARNVKKWLAEISKVKALTLSVPHWMLQVIFLPPAHGRNYIRFYSLTILKLSTSVAKEQTRARFHLLEMCPNLETLVLDIVLKLATSEPDNDGNEDFSSVDEECLQKKLPLKCLAHHLKNVEICGKSLELEKELSFVRFLLQNALVLERLSLRHFEYFPTPRILECVSEAEAITRAPNVKILLHSLIPDV